MSFFQKVAFNYLYLKQKGIINEINVHDILVLYSSNAVLFETTALQWSPKKSEGDLLQNKDLILN
jgi:hypothetical protein